MSYTPKYTSISDIERIVQFEITVSSAPNRVQTLAWIEEVERSIDSKKLGWGDGRAEGEGYLATNEYLDVVTTRRLLTPLEEFELVTLNIQPDLLKRGFLVPLRGTEKKPIISVSSLERRTTDLTEMPNWEPLVEGFYEGWTEAADTDYLIIRRNGRSGQSHGVAFFFYSKKAPYSGKARLRATYSYGWNLPGKILQRYASLSVAIKVLKAAITAGEPTRLAAFVGGDFQTFTNTQLEVQINSWKEELKEIERKYFPRKVGAGLLWL